MAGDGEEIRHHAEHVGEQDKGEEAEHQREELHAGRAGGASNHAGHELVEQFGRELGPGGNELLARGREQQEQGDRRHRQHHEQGRIGEGEGRARPLGAVTTQGEQLEDVSDDKLVDRVSTGHGAL